MDSGNPMKGQRAKTAFWWAITVVALAGVVFGVSALGASRTSSDAELKLSSAERSDRTYQDGMALLASGETSEAARLFERALELDRANTRAKAELDKLKAPALPPGGQDASADQTATPVSDPDKGYTEAISDLATLLPVTLTGYELGVTQVAGQDAQVPADPTAEGPVRRVKRVLFVAHDRGDTATAKGFVSSVSRTAYPQNSAEVSVNGIPAYFGTDGTRFATLAFSRGRFAFEVIITTNGPAPGALLDDVLAAAAALPSSH